MTVAAPARPLDRLLDWLAGHATALILLFGLFAFAVLAASLTLPRVDNQLIGSDGIGYYMYLPTLLLRHTRDFTPDINHFYQTTPDIIARLPRTPLGYPINQYPVGPALLWSPFFLLAHGASLLGAALGLPLATDGRSWVYQFFVLTGTIVYGTLGLLLTYHIAARFASRRAAFLATGTIGLGTNFLYYFVIEGSMSHTVSFFVTALLTWYWLRTRGDQRGTRWGILGLLVGLAFLMRPQDAVVGVLPLAEWIASNRRAYAPGAARSGIALGTGFLLLALPQLSIWGLPYGMPAQVPYLSVESGGHFTWLQPHLLETLFSTRHGVFLWHPVLLIGMLGLVLSARRQPLVFGAMLLAFALQAYTIAAWHQWWQGDAFGGRVFISTFPFLAIGLALTGDAAFHRRLGWLVLAAIGLTVTWNALFIVQYRFGGIPMSEGLTWRQFFWDKAAIIRRVLARQR